RGLSCFTLDAWPCGLAACRRRCEIALRLRRSLTLRSAQQGPAPSHASPDIGQSCSIKAGIQKSRGLGRSGSMRMNNRAFFLSLLASAGFAVGGGAAAQAQDHAGHDAPMQADGPAAVQSGAWSDAATWGGAVPRDGDIVTIASDMDIVL